MRRLNHNIFFVGLLCVIISLIITPVVFKSVNKIEPWILGLPFVTFWVVFLCLSMSFTLIAWYLVDRKRGDLLVDIERASAEEINNWKNEGRK